MAAPLDPVAEILQAAAFTRQQVEALIKLGPNITLTSAQIIAALGYTPVPNSRVLTAGTGLIGGGDLTANRSFEIDPAVLAAIVNALPLTLTPATTNAVTGAGHTHEVTGFLKLAGGIMSGPIEQADGATFLQTTAGATLYSGPAGATWIMQSSVPTANLLVLRDSVGTDLYSFEDDTAVFTGVVLEVVEPGTAPAGSFVHISSPGGAPGITGNNAGTKRRDIQFRTTDIYLAASTNASAPTKGWTINEDATLGRSFAATGTDRAIAAINNTDTGTNSSLSFLMRCGTGASMQIGAFAPSYTAVSVFTGKIAMENADSGVAMSAASAAGTHTWYTGVARTLRMTLSNAGTLQVLGTINGSQTFQSAGVNAVFSAEGGGGAIFLRPQGSSSASGQVVVTNAGILQLVNVMQISGLQVVGARNTGWGAQTGTATKTAYATWTHVAVSNPPTQTEVNNISTALQATDRRMKALTDALIAHGLIGT